MIAYLKGFVINKSDFAVTIDVQNVGYEVFCSSRTVEVLSENVELFIYTHYKAEGAALYGFLSRQEKELFLSLIKVDSVGPKSALNILSAAPCEELIALIEEGDVAALSKLPKISKKTAEHVVVKLKGKLSEIAMHLPQSNKKVSGAQKTRGEVQSALTHLGYKFHEVERVLNDIDPEIWTQDLQTVIRSALNDLSGNN